MKQIKSLLPAVTDKGFKSYFDTVYDPTDSWRAYLIKGGAGTGKSSLMKKVASTSGDENTVLGVCSSDPDSLDGVVFEDKKVCLLDATAPHIVEPKYPGFCETIINTGDGWDSNKLFDSREAYFEKAMENASLHKTAARYLGAAGRLVADNFYMESLCADFEKAKRVARALAQKEIKKGNGAKEEIRFISAVTPKGYLCFYDTITALCDRVIGIEDKWGAVGSGMLRVIKDYALSLNNRVILCPYPLCHDLILECLIIPEQRLSFVLCKSPLPFANRTIHTHRFCESDALTAKRQKMKFNIKAADTLIGAAADTMHKAKLIHDYMEKFYFDAMDFSVVDKLTQKIITAL